MQENTTRRWSSQHWALAIDSLAARLASTETTEDIIATKQRMLTEI